jgi:hypothetical protein
MRRNYQINGKAVGRDENGDPWLIYTDEYMDTSRPYFVYSRTPKIAVNPVIVEKIF